VDWSRDQRHLDRLQDSENVQSRRYLGTYTYSASHMGGMIPGECARRHLERQLMSTMIFAERVVVVPSALKKTWFKGWRLVMG
jgi:hypothetical protein